MADTLRSLHRAAFISCLIFSLLIYALSWIPFSYTQVDPNLVLSYQPWFYSLQQGLWQLSANRPLITLWYVATLIILFLQYGGMLLFAKHGVQFVRQWYKPWGFFLGVCALVFTLSSHPALSHDIYNYLFNAKMVVAYQANPHIAVALDFPQDAWLRFMHNVHTPAPYGYVWTGISLPAYLLSGGVFIRSFLLMKLFMLLGLILIVALQSALLSSLSKGEQLGRMLLFVANPLVIFETLSMGHNDVWMMVGALFSYWLILRCSWRGWLRLGLAGLVLFLSTQTKIATIMLVPVLLALVIPQQLVRTLPGYLRLLLGSIHKDWAIWSAGLIAIPLLTERSTQFHPWYLIWPLVFVPFITSRFVRTLLIVLSLTSLLRYVPFLLTGEYTQAVLDDRRLITWSALLIAPVVYYCYTKVKDRIHA